MPWYLPQYSLAQESRLKFLNFRTLLTSNLLLYAPLMDIISLLMYNPNLNLSHLTVFWTFLKDEDHKCLSDLDQRVVTRVHSLELGHELSATTNMHKDKMLVLPLKEGLNCSGQRGEWVFTPMVHLHETSETSKTRSEHTLPQQKAIVL